MRGGHANDVSGKIAEKYTESLSSHFNSVQCGGLYCLKNLKALSTNFYERWMCILNKLKLS